MRATRDGDVDRSVFDAHRRAGAVTAVAADRVPDRAIPVRRERRGGLRRHIERVDFAVLPLAVGHAGCPRQDERLVIEEADSVAAEVSQRELSLLTAVGLREPQLALDRRNAGEATSDDRNTIAADVERLDLDVLFGEVGLCLRGDVVSEEVLAAPIGEPRSVHPERDLLKNLVVLGVVAFRLALLWDA